MKIKESLMTLEEMKKYIDRYRSGDPLRDFYDDGQLAEWLYQFCLRNLGGEDESKAV